jgi:hypothetical protein
MTAAGPNFMQPYTELRGGGGGGPADRPMGPIGPPDGDGDTGTLGRMAELKTEQILALLAPIIIIQFGLMVAALVDLERGERRVRGGSKLVWALVIVFVNIVGPIIYFVAGREDA